MRKTVIIIMLFIFAVSLSFTLNDDLIASNIADVMIKEYDNYKNKSYIEKMILKMGKKAYVESVLDWKEKYKNLGTVRIKLHPTIHYIVSVGDKHLPPEKASYFSYMFENITMLAYDNLQTMYLAVKDYLTQKKLSEDKIDLPLIVEATIQPKYYKMKIDMYNKEDYLKKQIRETMTSDELKYRLGFYVFAFDFFNKLRDGIIKKDIEMMQAKISLANEKK
jgi:hypothetical protein